MAVFCHRRVTNLTSGETMSVRNVLATLLLCSGILAHPPAVRAAESYDNCAGTISSVPATITTQGVWCLKGDLSTAITTGNAITVNANNVTIDCNDFKIGGLAAGNSSLAKGVFAHIRQNITVRHCNVRGFSTGIYLDGGAGHLIEDNRLDNNLNMGVGVFGADNSVVRRNRVYDTGGSSGGLEAYGIYASAGIIDNEVRGVFTDATTSSVVGIVARGDGNQINGNHVYKLALTGSGGNAYGLDLFSNFSTVANNRFIGGDSTVNGIGIWGSSTTQSFCTDNVIGRFSTAMSDCADDGGNAVH
jgi:parallel beta-helix repeat protein